MEVSAVKYMLVNTTEFQGYSLPDYMWVHKGERPDTRLGALIVFLCSPFPLGPLRLPHLPLSSSPSPSSFSAPAAAVAAAAACAAPEPQRGDSPSPPPPPPPVPPPPLPIPPPPPSCTRKRQKA